MTGHVHALQAWEGDRFRISLSYRDPVPDEKIVEAIEFESSDPRFAGEMRITASLADLDDGTEITILCEDIPAGVRPEDNETGCHMSLRNLAALLEAK